MRYSFGLYWRGDEFQNFVFLWGQETQYRGEEELEGGPEVINGYLPWTWWEECNELPG
jgi:hypothetical protein